MSPQPHRRPRPLIPASFPELIDVAYVNRILVQLDALDGDTFRLYLHERRITIEIAER